MGKRLNNCPDSGDSTSRKKRRRTECKFVRHRTHIVSKQEAEDIEALSEGNPVYQWEMPAFDSSVLKWHGTGERIVEDSGVVATAPYGLKQELYDHWLEIYNQSGGENFESAKQFSFFNLCNSYRDILYPANGSDADSNVMDPYTMHLLNHVFKSQELLKKRYRKSAKSEEELIVEFRSGNYSLDRGFRATYFHDHGFPRPKVLILLPSGSTAVCLVRRLVLLTPSAKKEKVKYMDWFNKEFGADADADTHTEEDNDKLEAKDVIAQKPSYQALVGGNNVHFMIGIKFRRKSIKLYNDFYSSDIIIASPLGLVNKIMEAKANKGNNVDYLSSIEILVVDLPDIVAMQNWSHVKKVAKDLNSLPKIPTDRSWFVDKHAKFYRQTILLSEYFSQDIEAVFNKRCLNFEGKLRLLSPQIQLSEAATTIAMTYPPGACVHRNKKAMNFEMPPDVPKNLGLHGVYEIGRLSRRIPKNVSYNIVKKLENDLPFVDRLHRCMPYLSRPGCISHLAHEIVTHYTKISFLTLDSFLEFSLSSFEKHKFDRLLSYICERISLSTNSVTHHSLWGVNWIGVELGDLIALTNEYPPFQPAEVSIQLTKKKGYHFLYEIHAGLTKEGTLSKRYGPAVYLNKEKRKAKVMERSSGVAIPLDTSVLILPTSEWFGA